MIKKDILLSFIIIKNAYMKTHLKHFHFLCLEGGETVTMSALISLIGLKVAQWHAHPTV